MEHIHVVIADLSQLSRLGFISILNRMKYPFSIREISSPDKLPSVLMREQTGMFAISSAFLRKCSPSLIQLLQERLNGQFSILIHDGEPVAGNYIRFSETIESTDHDRIMLRKLEKQLSQLYAEKQEPEGAEEISDREKEVLRLVAIGLTNKEIADKLFISSHTVITHRKNITAKLGIKTIAGLTMYALINHLIVPEEKI